MVGSVSRRGNFASAKITKNRSEQVPPRHRVGTYLAYSSSRRSIASSRKKGVCVNYPHSLNVRSGIPGSNVLAPMSANLKNNKGDRQSRNEGHTFVLVHGGWCGGMLCEHWGEG